MLDHVVTKLVRNKRGGTDVQFTKDRFTVIFLAMFKHPLDHTAAVGMCRKSVDLALERVDDKLDILRRNPLDSFLDNVVTVLISHALENMVLKFFDHRSLLVRKDVFQGLQSQYVVMTKASKETYLLDYSAPVHLCRQRKHMPLHLVRQDLFLGLVTMFEQLLNDIVSKHVRHQLKAVRLDLTEHLFLFIAVGCFQFLLDETRSVLVTAEFNDMVVDVLQKLVYALVYHLKGE